MSGKRTTRRNPLIDVPENGTARRKINVKLGVDILKIQIKMCFHALIFLTFPFCLMDSCSKGATAAYHQTELSGFCAQKGIKMWVIACADSFNLKSLISAPAAINSLSDKLTNVNIIIIVSVKC